MGLLREQCVELRKGTFAVTFAIRTGTMIGGRIPWNATAICEMSKTSWQTGKLSMKDDLKNHFKGPIVSFWSSGRISSDFNARFIKTS